MPTKSSTPEVDTDTETTPPVHVAWNSVMQQALGLAKNEQFGGDGGGPRFNYRGIDALMNLVGPILRTQGVSIIPSLRTANYRDVTISSGSTSREVTVVVDYTIVGPAGDTMTGTSAGESLDRGDKGTAKAMSVAMRVFLLQALCLPTDEPDPDSEVFQRSGRPTPEQQAQKTADGVPSAVSVDQLLGVKSWAAARSLLDVLVTDAEGNSKTLLLVMDAKLEELAAGDTSVKQDRQANVDKALGGSDA